MASPERRFHAKIKIPKATELEAKVKLRIMDVIDEDLRRRFRTVQEVADYLQVEDGRIWNLRAKRHQKFSLSWLLRLAQAARVKMRIDIV
jgi:hypothetical protein